MEHMSVELRKKYMVIHIYGLTLNAAKSADQYYSSYSYIHIRVYPYEQTR